VTDSERLEQLLYDFGISFKKEPNYCLRTDDPVGGWYITVTAKESTRVDGYYGFFADFTFDADGKFTGAGVWE
jgi:hypothetical protein